MGTSSMYVSPIDFGFLLERVGVAEEIVAQPA